METIQVAAMIGAASLLAIAPPASVTGKLGEVFFGVVDAATKDAVIAYEAEPGATYEIYVVDGFNNGADPAMKVEHPSKAVVFWVLKEDGRTSYPQNTYTLSEPELDTTSPFRFVGVTPERSAAMSARIKAEGTRFFVRVQRNKNQSPYYGQFAVRVERP